METQSYENHGMVVPVYHYVLTGLLFVILIGACVNLYLSLGDHQRLYSASLLVALTLAVLILGWFTRTFPLGAQDRAIRAEENLRHYVLAGGLLDSRLTMRQIIGLRFASDDEYPALAARAAEEGMSEDDIKKAVRNWRADRDRI